MSGFPLKNTFPWSLLIGALVILATFLNSERSELDLFFISDALYLPSIYQDIFRDGGHLAEWSLNPAPNFFPDMGLYFLLNWVFGDLRWAQYVFPIVQFLLMAVLFRGVVLRVAPDMGEVPITLGVLLLVLVILTGWWGGDMGFAFHLLINSFHGGAFVNALLCSLLLLRAYDRRGKGPVVVLVLAIAAASVSDKLFWIMFTLPATVVCATLAVRSPARSRLALLAVVVLSTTVLSHKLLVFIDSKLPLQFEAPYAYLAFERVPFSWGRFVDSLGFYLRGAPLVAGTIVLGLVATVWAVVVAVRWAINWWRMPRVMHTPASDRMGMALGLMALFFPFVLLAPVANGSFDGIDSFRYNFAVFALAPLVAGVVIGRRLRLSGRWVVVAGLLGIGIPAFWICAVSGRDDYHRIGSYKPEVVADFDRLTASWGLRNGVANYWVAKRITLFSEQPVMVLPVYPDVAMYVHVNRPAMYFDKEFDFAIVHPELTRETLVHVFQQDTGFHGLGEVEVLLTHPWTFDPERNGVPRITPPASAP